MPAKLSEAIKTRKIQDFIAQQEAAGMPAADAKEFENHWKKSSKTPHKQIKHCIPALAVVRAESKFPQIFV